MQNNFQKKSLILSTLFFIISIAVFFVVYKDIENNVIVTEKFKEEWQKEDSRRQEIKTLDQSIKMIESERIELEKHFAKSSDVVPFLNTVESLGQKTGLKAKVFSVDLSKDQTSLLVEMKANGSFEKLYNFILLLENSPYEIQFDSINMRNLVFDENTNNKTKAIEWELILKIKLLSFIL